MTEATNNQLNQVYFTRLHWIIFFWPAVSLFLAIMMQVYSVSLRPISLVLQAFILAWIVITWATYYFSSITIKKKQVILRTGILIRKTVDIPVAKIETIDIRQSILGSIFRYGALVITGTGGTRHLVNYLYKPLTCRRHIEQLINDH